MAEAPHRITSTTTYTYPVGLSLLRQMLRMAAIMKDELGVPYPFEAACASLMLDIDRDGEPLPKSDYSRIWGWSYKVLRNRWEELLETEKQWRTSFGRLSKASSGEDAGANPGQGSGNDGATPGQQNDGLQSENGEPGQGSGNDGATPGQSWGKHTTTTPTLQPENKEGGDAREGLDALDLERGVWTEETYPILLAWRRWTGEPLPSGMEYTIRRLMMPRDGPVGATLQEDPATVYNGYSAEEVIAGIETFHAAGHKSPASLIKHVAGLMKPRSEQFHDKAHQGTPDGGGKTDYQRRREQGSQSFDETEWRDFADSLRDITEATERRPAGRNSAG